jgi:hypothetical protein
MHESTNIYSQESVKSPGIMSSVHRSVEVAAKPSSVVGVVAYCSKGEEAYSIEGETAKVDGMMELEMDYGGGRKSTYLTKREC